jgi:hypothetical protein
MTFTDAQRRKLLESLHQLETRSSNIKVAFLSDNLDRALQQVEFIKFLLVDISQQMAAGVDEKELIQEEYQE